MKRKPRIKLKPRIRIKIEPRIRIRTSKLAIWGRLFWMFVKVNVLSTSGPASVGLLYKESVGPLMTEAEFIEAVGFSNVLPGSEALKLAMFVAGIPDPLNVLRLARMFVLVGLTALTLISMMFLLMVRVSDPLVPRMIFGVLNVLLFFPSGAVYPINAFPGWMRAIATIDPFTYAVHGFKQLVLKNTGLYAIWSDMAFLAAFAIIAMLAATVLFKRRL